MSVSSFFTEEVGEVKIPLRTLLESKQRCQNKYTWFSTVCLEEIHVDWVFITISLLLELWPYFCYFSLRIMDFWERPVGWVLLSRVLLVKYDVGKKENWRAELTWARAWHHETSILTFQMTLLLSWHNISVTWEDWKQVIRSGICLQHRSLRNVKVKLLSRVWLFATPWTVAHQAPPSMGFSRQDHWSGLPFPSPGDLPDPGIEPRSPAL